MIVFQWIKVFFELFIFELVCKILIAFLFCSQDRRKSRIKSAFIDDEAEDDDNVVDNDEDLEGSEFSFGKQISTTDLVQLIKSFILDQIVFLQTICNMYFELVQLES